VFVRIPPRVRNIELPQFDVLNDLASDWQAKGADVIALGQALPGFDPPAYAIDELRRALDDHDAHIYSAVAGTLSLRRALSSALATLNGDVDPDRESIITAGGNQAFQLALTTLIDPGDHVVLVSPFFLNHEMAVRSVGAVPIEAPVPASRSFAAVWEDIVPHVTPRTTAVVLVSPSNPTGAVVAADELSRIVRECAVRNVTVFVDETYLRFTYETAPVTAMALTEWRQNVVVIGSFSKSFAITGWRCGYLIADAAVIAEALKIQDCMVICAPVPVQHAVAAVLEREPDYPARWLPELRFRRDFVLETLAQVAGVTLVKPAGGFFIMAKIDGMPDSRAGARALLDTQHVLTIPGAFFGRAGEGYLRISYGAASRERLATACRRIADFLRVS
jgi:aminotransferase